jgi:hypothetical protein
MAGPDEEMETLESAKRWHVAIVVSFILFLCSAGVGCYIAHAHEANAKGYVTVVGVAACAAALFIAICCFFGHVLADLRLGFPLNLTLPLIFCSLLPVASVLISTPEKGLLALQEANRFAVIWQNPTYLGAVFLGQVTALTLFAAMSRGSAKRGDEASNGTM